MEHTYWRQQDTSKPLFPDIEWSRPEQRSRAGRLAIVGGNRLGFAGVAEGYTTALSTGVGTVRVLLPDVLRKVVPPVMTDVVFGASNPSGSLSKDATPELLALAAWAEAVLLIGDAGRNSETAVLYSNLIRDYTGNLILTRDAVDLVKNDTPSLVERPSTTLVVSFAQLQKIFQAVYYPKILTFSMQLMQLVEAVHKFTITYPVTLVVLHHETLVVAHDGEVTTTKWDNPLAIWRGETAARASVYWLWNPEKPLEAISASLLAQQPK